MTKMFSGHLSGAPMADVINSAARAVAAHVVQATPPLKVPLAESATIRGNMSLQESPAATTGSTDRLSPAQMAARQKGAHTPKRFVTRGVPLLIAQMLGKSGMNSTEITDKLRGKVPAGWDRQNTSNTLTTMRQNGWVTKWPGNIWKLGPKPMVYKVGPRVSKNAVVVAKPKQDKPAVPRLERLKSAVPNADKVLSDTNVAIEKARDALLAATDALELLAQTAANLDTLILKVSQREKAVETARKLLSEAGI